MIGPQNGCPSCYSYKYFANTSDLVPLLMTQCSNSVTTTPG